MHVGECGGSFYRRLMVCQEEDSIMMTMTIRMMTMIRFEQILQDFTVGRCGSIGDYGEYGG